MNWHEHFEYRDGYLHWKTSPGGSVKVGDPAGTIVPRGYVSVGFKGKKYRAHRIIWEMHHGALQPSDEIDHRDGIRHHNKIENLLKTDSKGNHKNMAMRQDNTSGVTGVTFCKRLNKWKAYIKQNGKLKHLGCFSVFEDAVAARKEQEHLLGFSLRHGS